MPKGSSILKALDYIKAVNRTARAKGAIGSKAVVPQVVEKLAAKVQPEEILDYGAGKAAQHALALRKKGWKVVAYDIGENVVADLHDPRALSRQYDIVYASNVLNVQPSKQHIEAVLAELRQVMKPGGQVVLNFPKQPRKSGLKDKDFEELLRKYFADVTVVKKKNNKVYVLSDRPQGFDPSDLIWALLPFFVPKVAQPIVDLLTPKEVY